jgi:hypothetical protein
MIVVLFVVYNETLELPDYSGQLILRPTTNLRSVFRFLLYDDASTDQTVNTTLLSDGLQPIINGSLVCGNAIVAEVEEILHRPHLQ